MLQLSSLTKGYGDRLLFENVNWQVSAGERVGLCGPNGAGKTTLLRMVAGLDEADSGGVIRQSATTVGYLPQDGLSHSGRTLLDEVSTAFQPLLAVKQAMHEIEEQLADDAPRSPEAQDALLDRYSDLQHRFRDEDGYTIDLRVAGVLAGLGFTQDQFTQPTDTFSGGWQMRIALATLILQRPHVLLLDEPTNHLDLDARNWLEEFLADYPYALILVSHDRYFMDRVVTRIAEVGLRTLTPYKGSYTEYLVARDARISALIDQKRRQDEEIARVRLFIDRFRYQATKAAQVQSRIKMLDKIVPIEVPVARKKAHFSFPNCRRSGRIALELRGVRKAYGAAVVLDGVNAHIERGDRIAIVGPNGAGKSTLMRMLSGTEPPDSGDRVEGHNLVAQYFAQDEATRLDPTLTVYDTLGTSASTEMLPAIRNILGGFLFSGDDIHKPVGVLSGGERTRLAVARMLLQPSNTLMLDEPTNHLDIDSTNVLLDALRAFQGTLIFVSHDRYFVEQLATSIIEVGHGEADRYPGTYEEFRWSKDQRASASTEAEKAPPVKTQTGTPTASPATAATKAPAVVKAGRDERRQQNQDDRRRQRAQTAKVKRIDDLERRIADRERDIRDVEGSMAAPGFYGDRQAAQPVLDRYEKLMWEVGDLMGQWEALQEPDTDQPPSE
ncbi:MAG: ABC-F family ATP-binding cassette domain-containing protein [Acidobacteria bacterium]|nr:ABC-F family ATP-binding cassette domain-containing protein [Acidobacteriota bacterium]